MPQGPIAAATAVNPAGKFVMNVVDAAGNEFVASGKTGVYNIAGNTTTLIKGSAGRVVKICVNTALSAGSLIVYDSATTGGIGASNLVFSSAATPAAGSIFALDWPCANGIVIVSGTGTGVVSVSYI